MERVHRVDTEIRGSGWVVMAIGVAVAFSGIPLLYTSFWLFCLLLFAVGVAVAVYGIRMARSFTAGATVQVGGEELTVRSGESSIRIPWSDVDRWGVAQREVVGATSRFTQLVVWPTASPAPDTIAAAKPLWNEHHRGWVLTTYEPAPELLADLESLSGRSRQDALKEPDW